MVYFIPTGVAANTLLAQTLSVKSAREENLGMGFKKDFNINSRASCSEWVVTVSASLQINHGTLKKCICRLCLSEEFSSVFEQKRSDLGERFSIMSGVIARITTQ